MSGSRRAAPPMTCWTSRHEIPNAMAVSDAACPELMTVSSAATGLSGGNADAVI